MLFVLCPASIQREQSDNKTVQRVTTTIEVSRSIKYWVSCGKEKNIMSLLKRFNIYSSRVKFRIQVISVENFVLRGIYRLICK